MNILCLNISVKALSIDFMFFNPKMILRYLLSKSPQIEKKNFRDYLLSHCLSFPSSYKFHVLAKFKNLHICNENKDISYLNNLYAKYNEN